MPATVGHAQNVTAFLDRAIGQLRTLVAEQMTDTCVVTRQESGPGTTDPVTGLVTVNETSVYSGPCFLGDRVEGAWTSGGFGANPQEFAEDARAHNGVLRLPFDAAGAGQVQIGDKVVINSETWRVQGKERSTVAASRFYRIVRFDSEKSFS